MKHLDAHEKDWLPEDLVIHRSPLLLIDNILEVTGERCLASFTVDPTAWYAEPDGTMPGWFGIELMAQTISAFSGYSKRVVGESPRIGLMLGTRNYECWVPRFPAGGTLEVETTLQYLDESGLSAFACQIRHLGQLSARAILKTYEPL